MFLPLHLLLLLRISLLRLLLNLNALDCGISRRGHEIWYLDDCTESPKTYLEGLFGFPYDKNPVDRNWASCEFWRVHDKSYLGDCKKNSKSSKTYLDGWKGFPYDKSPVVWS